MGTSSVAQGSSASARRTVMPAEIPVVDAMIGAAAGWYYDPVDEAIYRWFDGEVWTGHRSDLFSSESPR